MGVYEQSISVHRGISGGDGDIVGEGAISRSHRGGLSRRGGAGDAECDYRYRALVARDAVGRWLSREVREVRYGNFKQSIGENFYHDACLSVWTEMFIWSKKLMGILRPMRKAG